jgi:hypothetical protein
VVVPLAVVMAMDPGLLGLGDLTSSFKAGGKGKKGSKASKGDADMVAAVLQAIGQRLGPFWQQ